MLCFDRLTSLKKLMLIKQMNQKTVIFVIVGIFKKNGLSFNQMSATNAMFF